MKTVGKHVLITGGGSGIGLSIAQEFLKNGATVIICGRSIAKLEQAKREHPKLEIFQCDVTNDKQIMALRDWCEATFGGIDILVNNAGIFNQFNVIEGALPVEHQIREIDIDYGGPIRMTHYFLPTLLSKSEAAIVNVSSGLAFIPFAIGPVYSGTKAALHSWTLSLRKQLADTNVVVFELMPPVVETEMTNNLDGIPKMRPDLHAQHFMRGFLKNRLEITPGISRSLKVMSRLAPKVAFNLLNRSVLTPPTPFWSSTQKRGELGIFPATL